MSTVGGLEALGAMIGQSFQTADGLMEHVAGFAIP
jgi:hypothetical protein